jgi:hypothetical protein
MTLENPIPASDRHQRFQLLTGEQLLFQFFLARLYLLVRVVRLDVFATLIKQRDRISAPSRLRGQSNVGAIVDSGGCRRETCIGRSS